MSLAQWSTTAASNATAATGINWAEGQAPSTVNDSARQMMADLRAEASLSATVVAAGTTDLSTATGSLVPISGNTTITGLGTVSAGIERKLLFTGAPTIVHNATSNILPSGAAIQAAAGDVAHAISEGSGNWRWHSFVRARPSTLNVYKASDQTVTNNNSVLGNDSDLAFAIAANEVWVGEALISVGAASNLNAVGCKVALTVPSGATMDFTALMDVDVVATTGTYQKRSTVSGTAIDFTTANLASSTAAFIRCLIYVVNGSTPGTVQIQFCQSTSSGTGLTFRAGSNIFARRMGL